MGVEEGTKVVEKPEEAVSEGVWRQNMGAEPETGDRKERASGGSANDDDGRSCGGSGLLVRPSCQPGAPGSSVGGLPGATGRLRPLPLLKSTLGPDERPEGE